MKKLNNRGFALAETLVVAVFVVTIFAVIFTHFFPLMAEYEKREVYDDVDGVYAAYFMKVVVENGVDVSSITGDSPFIKMLNCDTVTVEKANVKNICQMMFDKYNIDTVYITKYNLTDFKKYITETESDEDPDLEDYLNFLPYYSKEDNNIYESNYRVILKFKRKANDPDKGDYEYSAFSNMEVKVG